MRKLVIGDRTLTDRDVFVIAEIGSNHMGDPDVCEKMIIEAARCGVDAVKMQKRDNSRMFTRTALQKPYENEFSYGKTYGEHRDRLDWFGLKEFKRFKATAEKHGILFFATPFEAASVEFLHHLGVPLWKIASCDVTNIPMVQKAAGYGDPMIISTGGATIDDIETLWRSVSKINKNIAFLHCVSLYPNADEDLNLMFITALRDRFPESLIGFSSHHPGIVPLLVARSCGASIFEVHFTLNRSWKGTDHGFSLEPKGLAQAVEDLKRVQVMLGNSEKKIQKAESDGFVRKMGKGVYLRRGMKAGEIIKPVDICIKSPAPAAGEGLRPYEYGDAVGHALICDISTGVPLERGMVE